MAWGLGLRNGQYRPLILDANSWQDPGEGVLPFPAKRVVTGFYGLMDTLLDDDHKEFKKIPHVRSLKADQVLETVRAKLRSEYPPTVVA